MMKRELLDNGNIWQKSDGRWIGMVRYKDEFGVAHKKWIYFVVCELKQKRL